MLRSLLNCKACGASGELERRVLFADETALACMACGAVRVNVLSVEYSDNPHVDPSVVARPASLDAEALAWVSAFPRRTQSSDAFMPASLRATTAEALASAEAEARRTSAARLADRMRAAGIPGAPPAGHMSQATYPFQLVHAALSLSASSPLVSALVLAEGDSLAAEIARDHLAWRPRVLAEVAGSIHALRPDAIAIAVKTARATSPAEVAALAAAIRDKIARTDPYSSDVTELRRALDALAM